MTMFHQGSRDLQDRWDSRRLAERIETLLVRDQLTADDAAFIGRQDLFFLATADEQGRPNCSYKGGAPGFVRIIDDRTLAFPHYNGNGMFVSAGNVLLNPHVGMLFLDLVEPGRLRVNGAARIDEQDELLADYPEAQFVVRVDVREVFPNCPRYIHRHQRVEDSPFVPQDGCATPVPGWKRSDWASDVLPVDDPAHDATATVI